MPAVGSRVGAVVAEGSRGRLVADTAGKIVGLISSAARPAGVGVVFVQPTIKQAASKNSMK